MANLNPEEPGDIGAIYNWPALYVLTGHWKSDLEFFRDDLKFLHHIIEKYLIWITKKENLNKVNELNSALSELTKVSDDLYDLIMEHQLNLARIIDNPFKENASLIATEHQDTEAEMAAFVKIFRKTKSDVFNISEYIIDDEELAKLLP